MGRLPHSYGTYGTYGTYGAGDPRAKPSLKRLKHQEYLSTFAQSPLEQAFSLDLGRFSVEILIITWG
jgi:hypothetical protein